jgi:hypothetical protein
VTTAAVIEFAVLPDGSVDMTALTQSLTTVYPYRDDYRDGVTWCGRHGEQLRLITKVYNGSGHRVWLRDQTELGSGTWSVTWRGRNSDGDQVASGKYKVVLTFIDTAGHRLAVTRYVNVSAKRLYWYTKTLTKPGEAYCCTDADEYGSLSGRDSRYTDGVLVDSGGPWGDVQAGWSFTVPKATAYGHFTFRVLGRSPSGNGAATIYFNRYRPSDYGPYVTAGRSYDWYSTTVAGGNGYVSSTYHVRGYLHAYGDNYGAFDVAKVQLTYRYALLR